MMGLIITGAVITAVAFFVGYKVGESHEYDRERIKKIDSIDRQLSIMREAFMGKTK